MKYLMIAVLFLVASDANAQETLKDSLLYNIFPVADGQVSYEKVINAPGKPKSDIYKIIKSWAASNFVSQKEALQSDDLNAGLIIYKFNFESSFESPKVDNSSMTVSTRYWQNIKFYIKDDRLKVVVDNMKVDIGESTFIVSTYERDAKEMTEKYIQDFKKNRKMSDKMEQKMRENGANYDKVVMSDFSKADKEIKGIIASIEKEVTGKSAFDF